MAKKSQAIAILEGRLTLLRAEETTAQQALTTVTSQRSNIEDLLRCIKLAAAGARGGAAKAKRGKGGGSGNVVIKQQLPTLVSPTALAALAKANSETTTQA